MQLLVFVKQVRKKVEFVISLIMFSCVYVFGIGTTALVARLVGHRFLIHSFKKSSWQTPTGSKKIERMY